MEELPHDVNIQPKMKIRKKLPRRGFDSVMKMKQIKAHSLVKMSEIESKLS